MTTGHILPGYEEPVTKLKRVRSLGHYALDSSILGELEKDAHLSFREFMRIKENARQLWSMQTSRATTYNTYFSDGKIREMAQSRPTSSHRRNKPHPSQLFMTNKLHYIEGYHKPNTNVAKDAYKIDASLSDDAQKHRQALREKYVARPDSAFANQYKDPYGFKTWLSPRDAQGAEAWVKLADDDDQYRVLDVLKKQDEHDDGEGRPKTEFPSLHRCMKLSGSEEQGKNSRIIQTSNSNLVKKFGSYNNKTESNQQTQLRRGEYSIHPEWPSSLPHHKVP